MPILKFNFRFIQFNYQFLAIQKILMIFLISIYLGDNPKTLG